MVHSTAHRSYRSVVLLVAMLTGLAVLAFIQDPAAADPPFQPNVFTDGNGTCDAFDEDVTSTTILAECTLREAIMYTNANPGVHTINLAAGTYELSLPNNGVADGSVGDLDIETGNDLTIIGQGQGATTVDANSIDRVFLVHGGAKLTLKNLTVTGGFLSGAVQQDYYGAGISNWDSLVLENVEVVGNYFDHGGGISGDYYGAGVYNGGSADISLDSYIHGNGTNYGMAPQPADAADARAVDNCAGGGACYYGGGIYNDAAEIAGANLIISDSRVDSNTLNGLNGVLWYYGGGLYNAGVADITGGSISNNTVHHAGGGVYNTGTLTLRGTNVSSNSVWDYFGTGGGIYNNGTANVLATTLVEFNEAGSGGGVYNAPAATIAGPARNGTEAMLTVTDSSVSANYAWNVAGEPGSDYLGGGIYNHQGSVTLTNAAINANYAYYGGGIYNSDGTVTATDSAIGNSNVEECSFGQARSAAPRTTDALGGNCAIEGGGLYNVNAGTVTLTNTTVEYNSASSGIYYGSGNGGGVYNGYDVTNGFSSPQAPRTAVATTVDVIGGRISFNTADTSGGGAYDLGTMTLNGTTVEGNRAGFAPSEPLPFEAAPAARQAGCGGDGQGGGGVYLCDGSVTATNTTVIGNSAYPADVCGVECREPVARAKGGYANGGGISNYFGQLTFTGGSISGNHASAYGGGLYNQGFAPLPVPLALRDAHIVGHSLLTGTVVANNDVGGDGGIVAGVGGGGVYNYLGQVDIVDTTIDGNTAIEQAPVGAPLAGRPPIFGYGNGGGVHNVEPGEVNIDGSTISNNEASHYGGGIYNELFLFNATVHALNSTISGNKAEEGGGVYNEGTIDFDHVTVTNNDALAGGGVYNGSSQLLNAKEHTEGPMIDIFATIIAGNTADEVGPDCTGDPGVDHPTSGGGNIIGDDTDCTFTADPTDLVNVDALLGPLAANGGVTMTHLPAGTSPAVGLAAASTETVDQRDVVRPQPAAGARDSGAVEVRLPDAVDDAYSVDEEASLVVAAAGVLGNDSGGEGAPLTAAVVTTTPNGTLALAADGSLTYTPKAGFLGMDTFTYKATDPNGGSDTATGKITVNDIGIPGPGVLPNFLGNPETVGLFDDDTGLWRLRNSAGVVTEFYFGNPFWQPVAGNWNGDAHDTPGLYNDALSTWYLRNSNTQGIADRYFLFGDPGDYAIAGDWDGDGVDTPGVVRGDTVYLSNKLGDDGVGLGAADITFTITGISGGRPFAGDFNGDGKDEVGYTQPNSVAQALNMFFRTTRTSGPPDYTFLYGNPEDLTPNFGDWNDDFVDGPAVYRPAANWGPTARHFYLRDANSTGIASYPSIPPFGEADDLPISGRWGLG